MAVESATTASSLPRQPMTPGRHDHAARAAVAASGTSERRDFACNTVVVSRNPTARQRNRSPGWRPGARLAGVGRHASAHGRQLRAQHRARSVGAGPQAHRIRSRARGRREPASAGGAARAIRGASRQAAGSDRRCGAVVARPGLPAQGRARPLLRAHEGSPGAVPRACDIVGARRAHRAAHATAVRGWTFARWASTSRARWRVHG